MALIPGYEYDIFISYSHANNKVLPDQKDGWVQKFYGFLKFQLDQLSDDVKIWWDDKRLQGNTNFDKSIEEGIRKSAIMICLNSIRYQDSDYCNKELELFYEKAVNEKTGLLIANNRSRILNVLINNIPFDKWQKKLAGTSGFHFNDAEEKSDNFGDPYEYGTDEFKNAMKKLRDAIFSMVKDFPKEQALTNEEDKIKVKDENAFTIFIGDEPESLMASKKRIISELNKQGYNVITGIPTTSAAIAHEEAIQQALNSSQLAIHLLDQYPGKEIIDAPDVWYRKKQIELALQSNIPQIIWVPADVDFANIDDEKYKTFLQDLETPKKGAKSYEFIKGAKGELNNVIISIADEIKSKQIKVKPENGKFSILLDSHFKDLEYASDLYSELLQNQISTSINSQNDDPQLNINKLNEKISKVSKLVFLYGSVSKSWLEDRISVALKLIANNDYDIETYIYMAPPAKEVKEFAGFKKTYNIKLIDSSNIGVLNELQLQQFLNVLKGNTA